MTDRELAGCALSEVLALLDKATPGPWAWASNGNIVPVPYKDVEVAAVYSEHEDDTLMPANAKAIINAVAFLRKHGPALLAALSTPSSEGDGRDAAWRAEVDRFVGPAALAYLRIQFDAAMEKD